MTRLHIDHDVSADLLPLLRRAGHDIVTAAELGLSAAPDDVHLLAAADDGRVLLTYNTKDFILLHGAWRRWSAAWQVARHHAGILILKAPSQLSNQDSAREVDALLASQPPLIDELYKWERPGGWARQP